jgi:hypothetical protein
MCKFESGLTSIKCKLFLGRVRVPSRSICDWVMEYQGRKPSWKEKKRRKLEIEGKTPEPELPKDVKLLQDALRRSQLKSELLEEMLKLSEEYTGVDLRKKFGAKR